MTSIHSLPFHMYQAPLEQPPYTALTGTLAFDRMGCVIPVDTTLGAAGLTLEAPTKAGIIGTVLLEVDGGDLTLTVTNGYNAAGATTITFAAAGEFVRFGSIDIAGTKYWRVLAHQGTNATIDQATIQEIAKPAASAAEHGAGAEGDGLTPATYRYTRDGVIITEIHVDLSGLKCKGDAAKDAIALTGAGYIGRYVTATCGIVFRIELICIELPGEGTATITTDIDLGADDEDDIAYDGAVDDVVINSAALVAGEMASTDVPALTANDYLYLVEGDTTAATGVYNAGQYIIRMYGHALLA